MKVLPFRRQLLLAILLFAGFASNAQQATPNSSTTKTSPVMKTYLIEREIPGAGALNPADLKGISQKSCGVLKEMNGIEWVHSYVTENKIYCIYKAANEELIREHAKRGGFPANKIVEVGTVISPETAK